MHVALVDELDVLDRAVVAVEHLHVVALNAARLLYGEEDPSGVWCTEAAFRMEDEMGTRKFIVHLPHLQKEDINVEQDGGDLILTVRNETRRFHLPDRVSRRRASGWTYDGKELCIRMDYD